MVSARWTLAWAMALALVAAVPGNVRAQGPTPATDAGVRAPLVAERQRLRAELERVNGEIDALKRPDRGMRDDYRLRARLADAEALARRLTTLDAQLGTGGGPASSAGVEPRVAPGDGPTELAAKADILADQAQRLGARADALLGRAHELRARQNLRRRVGQMERDPFSPLEGSKRRGVATATGALGRTGSAQQPSSGGDPKVPAGGGPTPPTSQDSTGAPPPREGGPTGPSAPGTTVSTPTLGGGGVALSSPKSAPTPTGSLGIAEGTALSVQLRDLLDPTTLAELQRLEVAGGGGHGFEALERAGLALQARAERLRQQAAFLRAAAPPPPRPR